MTFAGFWAGKNIPNVFFKVTFVFFFVLQLFHIVRFLACETLRLRGSFEFKARVVELCAQGALRIRISLSLYIYMHLRMPTSKSTSFYDWSIHHPNLPPSEIRL